MARPSKTEQELGFLRSFWDECRMMEADYHAVVTVYCGTTGRPGVLRFRIVFTPMLDTVEQPLGSQAIVFDFPSSSQYTLAGALWQHASKLHTMVMDSGNAPPRPRKPRA